MQHSKPSRFGSRLARGATTIGSAKSAPLRVRSAPRLIAHEAAPLLRNTQRRAAVPKRRRTATTSPRTATAPCATVASRETFAKRRADQVCVRPAGKSVKRSRRSLTAAATSTVQEVALRSAVQLSAATTTATSTKATSNGTAAHRADHTVAEAQPAAIRFALARSSRSPAGASARRGGSTSVPRALRSAPRRSSAVVPARSGDHPDIHQLLLGVFHAPSRDEFHAWHERPGYDPQQRLLVKQNNRLAAHVLLTDYQMRLGGESLPVKQLHWLATSPEYKNQGYATTLLHGAEQKMRADGAVLGLLRTKIPHFLARGGWAVCGRQAVSHGRAREILARLSALPAGRRLPLSIRYWRHVELPSLVRIFAQNLTHAFGPFVRTEEDWRWLISRKAFDHIIVAIHGRDRMDLEDTHAPLTGYAVVRGQRVVELVASPDYPTTAEQLLARACGEMIESDRQEIAIEAPPQSEAHRYVAESGGTFNQQAADNGEALMVKLLDPARLIAALGPELAARLDRAELRTPCELGFVVDGQKGLLTVTRKGAAWQPGKLGRSYLQLRAAEFTRLLLGHGNLDEALAAGRITPSTQAAKELALSLFPPLPWWRPSWDELPA